MSQAFQAAAEEMKRLIEEKVSAIKADPLMEEVLKLHQSLNNLEDLSSQARTPLEHFFGSVSATQSASRPTVRFDEFVGLTPLEAAKAYLKKCREARPFAEIAVAISQGGVKIENEETFKTSLSRSTLEMLKLGDRYGLLEHYPNVKRGGKKGKGSSADSTNGATENASTDDASDLM